MSEFLAIHHVSVIVADTEHSLVFYRDALGLPVDPQRPDLGYPGAWLVVGNQQIHLLELPNPDVQDAQVPRSAGDRQGWRKIEQCREQLPRCAGAADPVNGRPAHGGRDRHVALTIRSLDALRQQLDAAGVAYTFSKSGRRVLFCRDPDGNALEFIEA